MLKKQAAELRGDSTNADELFAKGASVKLLASKPDVGSKELSKVGIQIGHWQSQNQVPFVGSCSCVVGPCIQSNTTVNCLLYIYFIDYWFLIFDSFGISIFFNNHSFDQN